jgi:ligand-binding sensor domain-containing protein
MFGDYILQTKDYAGGGVSRLDLATGEWSSFTEKDGLAEDCCCRLAADDKEVWVAHRNEERGLSLYDAATRKWSLVRQSANGVVLGGTHLALDGDSLWIGQHSGVVRLDRKSREATAYPEKDGLPGYSATAIAIGEKDVWVGACASGSRGANRSGLAKFPREAAK